MRSNSREEIAAAFDALDAAVDAILALNCDGLTTPERFTFLARNETVRRRLPAFDHPLINEVSRLASRAELGGKLSFALAGRLHITGTDANRRIHHARDWGHGMRSPASRCNPCWPPPPPASALDRSVPTMFR